MKKYMSNHPYLFCVIFWLIYTACFFLVEQAIKVPKYIIHTSFDDLIPFNRHFIYFYILWFPYIVISFLYLLKKDDKSEFWRLQIMIIVSTFATLLFYVLVPNGIDLRPAGVEGNDLSAFLVRFIWQSDNSCNVCPSIHVFISLMLDNAWQRNAKSKIICYLSHFICFMICLSTLFLKQHSIIDVLSGIVVVIVMEILFRNKKFS